MAEPDQTCSRRQCAQCGARLPQDARLDLCPQCLLKAGLETQPATGPGGTVVLPAAEASGRGLPRAGERLGHFQIVRLLGHGGMGTVFEAEDLESGRRVALKVLSQKLDSPEARERFFREGRLAASINHPNSVYIFGTEEIGGTPVIAMELAPGGTLQDRVRAQGPLAPTEAVDGVLQIIAGLEAARRIGILHRDIKPSNCFLDADGTVKIGDFGLSISTSVRIEPALTANGVWLGTPAFCSPEQLRGDELNARSDMYSVGATFFYLLTGRVPFGGINLAQLIANVLELRTPSPREFRKDIPHGLARVVQRCLEKQPAERFKSYDDLRRALAPYSSASPTPATLGLRFLAGLSDMVLLGMASLVVQLALFGNFMAAMNSFISQRTPKALGFIIGGLLSAVLYYALLEGFRGASVGKAICRLRVVGPDNSRPGFRRALVRALFYVILPLLPYWLIYGTDPVRYLRDSGATQTLMGFSFYVVLTLLFCTMRRRNGFAAVHDLATRTRVVSRVALQSRPLLPVSEAQPAGVNALPVLGPYHLLESLGTSAGTEWLLGYDLRLLRKVWIRAVPPGTPPAPASLRNIGRVGRLRWLAGRRSQEENWDAFEAATGKPLPSLARTRQPWSQVRFWLSDLANEIGAAEKDGTLPPALALDRVWITSDGRAKLLDLPAPGIASNDVTNEAALPSANRFLGAVAAAALEGDTAAGGKAPDEAAVPLPLHARAFLERLPQLAGAGTISAALTPLLSRVAEVTRLRRLFIIAGCAALPVFACLSMMFGLSMLKSWERTNPGLMELNRVLAQWTATNFKWIKNKPHPGDDQFAIYIAAHFRNVITNASWNDALALMLIKGQARQFAEQSVAKYPAPTAKEIADADAALKPYAAQAPPGDFMKQPAFAFLVATSTLTIYVGIPAVFAALLFRGGLVLLLTGVTFVRRDGARASRLRVLWRALVAWSPMVLALVLCGISFAQRSSLSAALGTGAIVALTILSVALPNRGLPDRLAGTWPVPR
jgi:eukaryotic-like serine/threonine-protein kinase